VLASVGRSKAPLVKRSCTHLSPSSQVGLCSLCAFLFIIDIKNC
jgi:hypothetical protein